VRAVETAVEHDAAVQMDDRSVRRPFPAGDPFAALLVVLPDPAIRDGVEIPLIDGDTLPRLRRAEPSDLFEAS